MVVADGKTRLIFHAQMPGHVYRKISDNFRQTLLVTDAEGWIIELRQMMILELEELGKDRHRTGRGRTVEPITDGCIDARLGIFLNLFQYSKEPSQQVAGIGISRVEGHEDLLLIVWIASLKPVEVGLEKGRANGLNPIFSVAANPAESGLEERLRIWRAIQDRAHEFPRQIGWNILTFILSRNVHEQSPKGIEFRLSLRLRNAEILEMLADHRREFRYGADLPEADGYTRRIGRESENKELLGLREV